ncbi:MAG: hypothetical protein Q8O53_01245, partial [Candidatus Moranbacteria bacterium]|nr:hypothetical protein [Candidatus Moranbacteria bacterium]
MVLPTPLPIPPAWHKRYTILRALLYLVIVNITIFFALRVFFPTVNQSFDFRSPSSSKNAITNPRSTENTPRTNGKIEQGGTLVANTAVLGDFSSVSITAALEKNSLTPETLRFSLRRSYQSFFYPTGEKISYFPYQETTYLIDGTYYVLRDDVFYPFVSEQAFLSRAPKEHAATTFDSTLLDSHPVSETWLGFRVGSLLSNATGVFIVVSDTEVRPVGSAEIFLALGYNFADVIPVSEEELGIYKRGRIFLLWAAHPDGTLLFDQDTNTYYLIEQGTKRPLIQPMPGYYLDFLTKDRKLHPIVVSSVASNQTVTC